MRKNRTITLIRELIDKGYSMGKTGKLFNPNGVEVVGSDLGGYMSTWQRLKGTESIQIRFHQIQAYQKFGEKMFEKGIVVRHLDGNPLNNHWDNIAIGTQSDNMLDIPKKIRKEMVLRATRANQNNIRSKKDRELIYKYLSEGKTYRWIIDNTCATSLGTLSYMKNKSLEFKEYLEKKRTRKENKITHS